MDKFGDYKWNIIISLILGLMVLSLSLYFIFHELWTDDDAEREICRQSIQLRALLPDSGFGIEKLEFKSQYPLKCKTHVVEIEEGDVVVDKKGRMEAEKKIAEAIVGCWELYGRGDVSVFPAKFHKSSTCVPCARIHLTDEAKVVLGDNRINIKESLELYMMKEYSYKQFLRDSGKKFSAFNFGNAVSFDLGGENFDIKGFNVLNTDVVNKINGETTYLGIVRDEVSLPEFLDPKEGDLMINYGVVVLGKDFVPNFIKGDEFGDYIPYMFYFQSGQDTSPDPFEIVQKRFIANLNSPALGFNFCETWDGIPA